MSKKEQDPYELKRIYEEMELELTASLRRNLLKHKMDEHAVGFSYEMWQSALLRNIKEYRKENTSIIYKAKSYINNAIKNVLHFFYKKGKVTDTFSNDTSKIFPQEGANTGKVGHEPTEETNFFAINKKKVEAMIRSTKSDFGDIDKAIYRKMDDVYRQIIHNVGIQMAHGTISLDKAIDISMEKFLAKGIDSIIYKNGRQVNVATYAEMALRTASQRASFLGGGAKRDELGVHLVFVSAHASCCELCRPWQGQILIDDVFSHPSEEYIALYKDKYKLLSKAIKAGLLHPNCRHTISTYFEGITKLPTLMDDETVQKNYAAEQKQRHLENKIRLAKRIKAGVVNEANEKEATFMLRKYQKLLRYHLKTHPELKRHEHREKIYEEKGISSLLNQDEKKAIKKYVSPSAYTLNDKLRNGIGLSDIEKAWVKNLDAALNKMPTYKGLVTRSVEFLFKEDLNDFVESHIVGKEKNYHQYISSTKGSVYNEVANVQLEIISKSAKDISYYNWSEKEVLFKPNVNFVVVEKKVIKGVHYIKLEEL